VLLEIFSSNLFLHKNHHSNPYKRKLKKSLLEQGRKWFLPVARIKNINEKVALSSDNSEKSVFWCWK
jgi:hypothetical protein